MSRQGLAAAKSHGQELPSFSGQAEAEVSLLAERDRALAAITAIPALTGQLDYTPESLDRLEGWFFSAGQPSQLTDDISTGKAIGFYLGEVYCRSAKFAGTVQEFVFAKGQYGIGVTRGLATVMLTMGRLPMTINNKRKQSLRRSFSRYSSNTG